MLTKDKPHIEKPPIRTGPQQCAMLLSLWWHMAGWPGDWWTTGPKSREDTNLQRTTNLVETKFSHNLTPQLGNSPEREPSTMNNNQWNVMALKNNVRPYPRSTVHAGMEAPQEPHTNKYIQATVNIIYSDDATVICACSGLDLLLVKLLMAML